MPITEEEIKRAVMRTDKRANLYYTLIHDFEFDSKDAKKICEQARKNMGDEI